MRSSALSLAALTLLALTVAPPAQRVAVVRQPVIVQQPVAVVVQNRRVGPVRRVVGAVRGSVRGARLGFQGF
jgi:hypothetical protein